ncbi:MAG: helix-turn-helix domain-containing protein, partial [Pseudomonadota bacterium]
LRPDFLFRLEGFAVTLPPLQARLDDIPLLANRFLQDSAASFGGVPPELGKEELGLLMTHDWPGNVRELRNVIERFVFLSRMGEVKISDAMSGVAEFAAKRPGLREAVAAFERQMISRALQDHNGRMEEIAGELGIGRRTLNEKIVKLGLDKEALL